MNNITNDYIMKTEHGAITAEDNACILEIDNVKIVAKNPRIALLRMQDGADPSNIVYFDYTLQISQKFANKWEQVVEGTITEAGAMPHLPRLLDQLLTLDVVKDGLKRLIEFPEMDKMADNYECIYPFNIYGFFQEDNYRFTKCKTCLSDKSGTYQYETYDLSIFVKPNAAQNPQGVFIEDLEREDIELIRNFAKIFMDIACQNPEEVIEKEIRNDERT